MTTLERKKDEKNVVVDCSIMPLDQHMSIIKVLSADIKDKRVLISTFLKIEVWLPKEALTILSRF